MEEILNWLESESRNYQVGLALLGRHSQKTSLVAYLGKKQNQETEEKLAYELEKLIREVYEPTEEKETRIAVFQPEAEESAEAETLAETEETTEPATGRIKLFNPEEKQESAADEKPSDGRIKLFKAPTEVQPDPLKVGAVTHIAVDGQLADRQALLDDIEKEMSKVFTLRAILSNSFSEDQTDEQRKDISDRIESFTQQMHELGVKRDLIHDGQLVDPAAEPVETSNPAKAELQLKRRNLASNVTKAKKAYELDRDNALKQEKYAKLAQELQDLDMQIKLA